MGTANSKKKPSIYDQFRKISKFVNLEDKAICFISSWEHSGFNPLAPEFFE